MKKTIINAFGLILAAITLTGCIPGEDTEKHACFVQRDSVEVRFADAELLAARDHFAGRTEQTLLLANAVQQNAPAEKPRLLDRIRLMLALK